MSILHPIRVMLVDDHKTMLWGLEKLLEDACPTMEVVASVGTIGDAVALTGSLQPDIVVLDVDLDGVCSVDFVPALVANGVPRALMFSGTRDQEMLARAVRNGARGVIGKEVAAAQVIDAIARVHRGELCLDQALLGNLLGALIKPVPAAAAADPEAARIALLTLKERKIVAMMVEGNGALNKTIAQRAFISEQTLRNHLTSIYSKLDVANRLELYVYALKNGLAVAHEC
ncbi:response regulator transcription factor [Janthinobacterium sp.]|uniref:response regulator transcription factor n=1 Tax=Janthinobacterium sp. TaxID=1871054 RepID=UPI0025896E8A|nr:response regulator transcription factor [Janthinobacterium sp.]MCX7294195.1 response regulator transcription factor [Janthinobacterium sp.]